MAVRTTVDIPDELHQILRQQAARSGNSIRSLVVCAIEAAYLPPRKGRPVTGALIKGPAKLGPDFPVDENPYDLVLP